LQILMRKGSSARQSKARTYCEITDSSKERNGNVRRKPVKRRVAHAGVDLHDNRDFMIPPSKGEGTCREHLTAETVAVVNNPLPSCFLIGSDLDRSHRCVLIVPQSRR